MHAGDVQSETVLVRRNLFILGGHIRLKTKVLDAFGHGIQSELLRIPFEIQGLVSQIDGNVRYAVHFSHNPFDTRGTGRTMHALDRGLDTTIIL